MIEVVASLAILMLATCIVCWVNRREPTDRLRDTRERRQMHIREDGSRRFE
jgi:hypothetical protein